MSLVNYKRREINVKVVYYGPGLAGKTANLQYIFEKSSPDARGPMTSLQTDTERTLFFDFLPIDLGQVRGFKLRLSLYTVPGQVFYDASRKAILKGADGVAFVADSQASRIEANEESVENLALNLVEHQLDLATIPYVIQYNKRDLPNLTSIDELRALLNPFGVPDYEASARTGQGVFETLKGLTKMIIRDLSSGASTGSARAVGA